MILRKVALAAASIAALSPAISNASPERVSAKACASAFASSIAAPAYKLAFRGAPGSTLSDFYPSEYTFTLEARDPKSRMPIARAVCSTDHRGTVTTISAVPLSSEPGKLASQM